VRIFHARDYRAFLKFRLQATPGKGQLKKLADHLGVHPSLLTQLLAGNRNLTSEQAFLASQHLGLDEDETEYLLTLVQLERASKASYRARLKAQLDAIRARASGAEEQRADDLPLAEHERAIFYSTWHYVAIHLLAMVPRHQSLKAIASYFELPEAWVRQVLEFLFRNRLLVDAGGGKWEIGPRRTHVKAGSPLAVRNSTNWRLKGIEHLQRQAPGDLFYSAPMVIGKAQAAQVAELLRKLVEETDQLIERSPSEETWCLNLDWFRF
jgi:uncharacterized protein (TIGR02147 family)